MVTREPFLNTSRGAYHHRNVPSEDEELTHVGPGTPCGEYLRRFWQPVAVSDELKDLPLRIRIMGENLALYRDGTGRVGLLELHCAHRGTSLEFGQICERGIRCCYHGWLYDADGKILETPGEPPDSTLKDRLYHGAYPTIEYAGLVFAYMGPPDKKLDFSPYDCLTLPGHRLKTVLKHFYACNWLQTKENGMDPVHLGFLHAIEGNIGFAGDFGTSAELDFRETPLGMTYISTRRVGDNVWVRTGEFINPNVHQFPAAGEGGERERYGPPEETLWSVPVDDAETVIMGFRNVLESEVNEPVELSFGTLVERPYEERQRVPGDYDAQTG